MNVEVAVIDLSERGVQVTLGEDDRPFWIPRSAPGVGWSAPPQIGDVVYVRIPVWLAAKHRQLQALRYQRSLSLHQPPDLNPDKAKGRLPMANDNELRGALFRETDKKSEKSPDMTGHITIDGIRYRLAGWTREGKDGRKYLSLAASVPEEQRQQPAQQKPAGGPTFRDEEAIPFAMEWR